MPPATPDAISRAALPRAKPIVAATEPVTIGGRILSIHLRRTSEADDQPDQDVDHAGHDDARLRHADQLI